MEEERENMAAAAAVADPARYPRTPDFTPQDPGPRDAIFRDVISCDAISRDVTPPLRDIIFANPLTQERTSPPLGPLFQLATVAPTIGSCIPELKPAPYTYFYFLTGFKSIEGVEVKKFTNELKNVRFDIDAESTRVKLFNIKKKKFFLTLSIAHYLYMYAHFEFLFAYL